MLRDGTDIEDSLGGVRGCGFLLLIYLYYNKLMLSLIILLLLLLLLLLSSLSGLVAIWKCRF